MEKEVTLFVIRKSFHPTSVTKVPCNHNLTKDKKPYLRNLYVKVSEITVGRFATLLEIILKGIEKQYLSMVCIKNFYFSLIFHISIKKLDYSCTHFLVSRSCLHYPSHQSTDKEEKKEALTPRSPLFYLDSVSFIQWCIFPFQLLPLVTVYGNWSWAQKTLGACIFSSHEWHFSDKLELKVTEA